MVNMLYERRCPTGLAVLLVIDVLLCEFYTFFVIYPESKVIRSIIFKINVICSLYFLL